MAQEISVAFASSDDIPSLHNFFMKDFFETSNLNAPIGLRREDAEEAYMDLVKDCVASGTSLIIRNEVGKVIAMRLSTFAHRSAPESVISYQTRIQLIFDLLAVLTENKWDLIPKDVDKVLYVEILSVSVEYRGRGLAKILTSVGLEEAKAMGATGIMAESTSIASQTLFSKLGYDILRELSHSEFVGENGKPIFSPLSDNATTARFVFKKL